MKCNEKILYLIKNEVGETIGVYFSTSLEKLVEYIEQNNLFPKTDITIEEFEDKNKDEEVVQLVSSERFLWYELKHHNIIHIVK